MRISLPGLETVGWFNGKQNEGEARHDKGLSFGGECLLTFMKEWLTAHVCILKVRLLENDAFIDSFGPPTSRLQYIGAFAVSLNIRTTLRTLHCDISCRQLGQEKFCTVGGWTARRSSLEDEVCQNDARFRSV